MPENTDSERESGENKIEDNTDPKPNDSKGDAETGNDSEENTVSDDESDDRDDDYTPEVTFSRGSRWSQEDKNTFINAFKHKRERVKGIDVRQFLDKNRKYKIRLDEFYPNLLLNKQINKLTNSINQFLKK